MTLDMPPNSKSVDEYLKELERTKAERPDQIKDALDIYIDLWKKAIQNGVVSSTDPIEEALLKIEGRGGLYDAAEG